MKTYFDIAYGALSEAQKLDLYLPDEGNSHPLIVFIHGGDWCEGDKRDGQEKPWIALTAEGYAAASINYRLSDEAKYPAGINDCRNAVAFLKKRAEEYGFDKEKVCVCGGSSGGHYALMTGMAKGRNFPECDCSVSCMIGWYPVCDLGGVLRESLDSDRGSGGALFAIDGIQRLMGKKITDPDNFLLTIASPSFFVSKDMPPVLLQHGTMDSLCPVSQTIAFYESCLSSGAEAKLDIVPGAKHMDRKFAEEANMNKVKAFLSKYMK